jgi:hypothetical protein
MKNATRKQFVRTQFTPSSATILSTNPFVAAMQNQANIGYTEKGAVTNKSTMAPVLDWFGAGGALRQRQPQDIVNLFSRAFAHDPLSALKVLFYFRDVREGQGERNTFRIIMNWLGQHYPDVARKNIENVAFFGRYDDLYSLVGTPLEKEVFALFAKQLKQDLRDMKDEKSVSLLAKWLKSENTSSAESRNLGRKTREALELTPKRYRKILASLRKYIDVLEVKMCGQKWSEINFERVPSKASLNYRKAFGKHDQERYAKYLESVKKGEAKMNASAVFPYEIFRSLVKDLYGRTKPSAQDILQADLQWKSMPNWLEGNDHKGLVIADVSGSMFSGIPNVLVAVSLALYFAERNTGPFKDMWMNFSESPTFQRFSGNNIYEKYQNMDKNNWGGTTNLQSAFNMILDTAVRNKVDPKEMPSVLYIVSDMEFDTASGCNTKTNFQVIREKYEKAGYALPRLVWWNVASRNDQFPIRATDSGTALVSGCSPSILKSLLSAKTFDPMSVVWETINKERYNRVTV